MSVNEHKWQANREKVAFAQSFPGMLTDLSGTAGREIAEVLPLASVPGAVVLLFTDHTFLFLQGSHVASPPDLMKTLAELRPRLESYYGEAYIRLDELGRADRELGRRARMHNILGAIRTNIDEIPELFEHIPDLLKQLEAVRAARDADSSS